MFVKRNLGDVIVASPNTTPITDEKNAATQNIITLVRASQKNGVPIDYDGMIKSISDQYGVNDPEVIELTALLNTLRNS